MDFVGAGGSGTGGLGSDNGPILYSEPNRTSAIDDLRSVVIYVFIVTIILGFLLILPGVRNEKIPTFLCIATSIIVTSIILIVLFGTTWHVGQAPISSPYKAFSKDRIQGELSVKIGLRSVNITLRAHKYYELHVTYPAPNLVFDEPPPIIGAVSSSSILSEAASAAASTSPAPRTHHLSNKPPATTTITTTRSRATQFIGISTRRPSTVRPTRPPLDSASRLAEELLSEARNNDDLAPDTDDEVFSSNTDDDPAPTSSSSRRARSSDINNNSNTKHKRNILASGKHQQTERHTIERSNVDINYNERFHWIEPDQMRQEHHNALQRGLPYPILTVVEYLSQDEGGFSWSRQYRAAGYYSYILLWLSFCTCILMFFLHCAAPKYGIYTMQAIGCLLLFTNFTYATLVPKGDRKLVIPFEGQAISLEFGSNYWLVLIGGCLSLVVGTLIVILDNLFPNFIFTTILDVDFDSHTSYYRHNRRRQKTNSSNSNNNNNNNNNITSHQQNHGSTSHLDPRPLKPPFLEHSKTQSNSKKPSSTSSVNSDLDSSDTAEVLSVARHKAQSHYDTKSNSGHGRDGGLNKTHLVAKNNNLKSTDQLSRRQVADDTVDDLRL